MNEAEKNAREAMTPAQKLADDLSTLPWFNDPDFDGAHIRMAAKMVVELESKLGAVEQERDQLKTNCEYLANGHKRADTLQIRLETVRKLCPPDHPLGAEILAVLDVEDQSLVERQLSALGHCPGCGVTNGEPHHSDCDRAVERQGE